MSAGAEACAHGWRHSPVPEGHRPGSHLRQQGRRACSMQHTCRSIRHLDDLSTDSVGWQAANYGSAECIC